jgi:PAS domain S-box-containing protein
MADHAPVLLWMAGTDSLCWFFNQGWLEFTGRTLEQEFGNGWAEGVHPEDFQHCMAVYLEAFVRRERFTMEYRLRRADGSFRWVYDIGTPRYEPGGAFAGYIGSCVDITEQREVRETLKRSNEQVRQTIEAAPTGMLMTDEHGTIVMINSLIERLFGYDRTELIGQPVETLIPERFRGTHPEHRAGYFAERRARPMGAGRDLFGRRKDGSEVPIEIGLNPLQTVDGFFVLGSVVDITERKRAEVEREALLRELSQLNVELHDRVGEREALLQEIHHRVKNNLQVVASMINMQIRRSTDSATRSALGECRTRLQAMGLLHEKLYQSDNHARVPFPEYAKSLASHIFDATGTPDASVSMDVQIDDVHLPMVQAIPCGLILSELMSNAFRHAFPNGRHGKVRVGVRREGSRVSLEVADDGIGLPEGTTFESGSSLGWQLVSTFAQQLDATVSVESDAGTRIRVAFDSLDLPLSAPAAEEQHP